MISTPFLCSLFPALTSLGCLLLVVICCVISRALPEERGILANDHCSCSCKTLSSSREFEIHSKLFLCLQGEAGGTGHTGLLCGCSWLPCSSALPSPHLQAVLPSLVCGWWCLLCPSWFMRRGSHDPQELLCPHLVTPMFQPSEVTSVAM